MSDRQGYLGQSGFNWWTGVVVDRNDPLMLGRCKVRIKGVHSENVADVPNEDLPWTHPLNSINNSMSTNCLKEGDCVMGFFMDGTQAQYPVVMGNFPHIPEESIEQKESGFCDVGFNLDSRPQPIEKVDYNLDGGGAVIKNAEPTIYPRDYDQPTTSKIARKEDLDKTIVQRKNESVVNVPSKPEKAKLDCPFDGFTELFSDMKKMAKDAIKSLAGAMSPVFSFLGDVADAISGGLAAVQKLISDVTNAMSALEKAALDAIKGAVSSMIDKAMSAFDMDADMGLDLSFITETYAKLSAMYESVSKTINDFLHSPCIEAFTDQFPDGINIPNIHDILDTPEFDLMTDKLADQLSTVIPDNFADLSNTDVLNKTLSTAMAPMQKEIGDYLGSKITPDLISSKFTQNLSMKSAFDLKKLL